MLIRPDEVDPLLLESTLIAAAAPLTRSVSSLTHSTNSSLLALALKRKFRDDNSALSAALVHRRKALICSTSIPVDADNS